MPPSATAQQPAHAGKTPKHELACVAWPVWWSGKEVRSPEPPPLRTGRARFHAYGSSLHQRPSRNAADSVNSSYHSESVDGSSRATTPGCPRHPCRHDYVTNDGECAFSPTALHLGEPYSKLLGPRPRCCWQSSRRLALSQPESVSPRLPLSPRLRTRSLPTAHAGVADC